jgi:hypothetical protein
MDLYFSEQFGVAEVAHSGRREGSFGKPGSD